MQSKLRAEAIHRISALVESNDLGSVGIIKAICDDVLQLNDEPVEVREQQGLNAKVINGRLEITMGVELLCELYEKEGPAVVGITNRNAFVQEVADKLNDNVIDPNDPKSMWNIITEAAGSLVDEDSEFVTWVGK